MQDTLIVLSVYDDGWGLASIYVGGETYWFSRNDEEQDQPYQEILTKYLNWDPYDDENDFIIYVFNRFTWMTTFVICDNGSTRVYKKEYMPLNQIYNND